MASLKDLIRQLSAQVAQLDDGETVSAGAGASENMPTLRPSGESGLDSSLSMPAKENERCASEGAAAASSSRADGGGGGVRR